jgi:hypothetical protein
METAPLYSTSEIALPSSGIKSGWKRSPSSSITCAIANPQGDLWTDHFQLDAGKVLPLTAIGRVTVRLLQLNCSERVAERRLLFEAKLFKFPVGQSPSNSLWSDLKNMNRVDVRIQFLEVNSIWGVRYSLTQDSCGSLIQ